MPGDPARLGACFHWIDADVTRDTEAFLRSSPLALQDAAERYWACEHRVTDRKTTPFGVKCGLCGYLFSAANPIPPFRPVPQEPTP